MAASSLQTAIDNIDAVLAEITANPQPSYSIDGQSVSHDAHLETLIRSREKLQLLLIQAEGPGEVKLQGW